MRRTIILSAVGAIAFTIGLGVSATLASGATEPSTPTNSTSMMNGTGMDNMMNGTGMDNMMGSDGMDTVHTAMHDALSDSVPADVLAACDTVHTSMSSTTSSPNSLDDGHAAHHPGAQP